VDSGEHAPAEHLDGDGALRAGEIEGDRLGGGPQIEDRQDGLAVIAPDKGEDSMVLREEKLERAAAKGPRAATDADDPLGPAQE